MSFMFGQQHRFDVIVLVAMSTACHGSLQRHDSTSRYVVTERPIDVGAVDGLPMRLCIAIDASDRHGVWWWEAGSSGCSSRSTGPDVFRGDQATVSRSSAGSTTASFRLAMHSTTRPYIDVRLVMEDGQMRTIDTGAQVPVRPRSNLDLPEMAPRGVR